MNALDYTNRVIDEIFGHGNSMLTPRLPPVTRSVPMTLERAARGFTAPHYDSETMGVFELLDIHGILEDIGRNIYDEMEIGRLVKRRLMDAVAELNEERT